MSTLENWFLEKFREFFRPQVFIPFVLIERLKKLGITLTADQEESIKRQFNDSNSDSLRLELSPEQEHELTQNGIDPNNIQIDLDDFQIDWPAIEEVMSNTITKTAEVLSKSLIEAWIQQSSDILKEQDKQREQFNRRLQEIWGDSLRLLEILISVCHQSGADFNSHFRSLAAQENDFVFEVLTRLHARACQVASEALVLLKNGFADGAHARWRTLHEITVTAMFISKYGKDVAERYLRHASVAQYLDSQKYQEYCTLLGYEPLSTQVLEGLKANRDEVVKYYGPKFGNENGWAAGVLKRTRFVDIERDVDLTHFRPFYKLANMNVHAGSLGIAHRLGMPPGNQDLLISGSSIYGIAEPGQNVAVSLQQLTVALLLSRSNLDHIGLSTTVQKLMREVVWSFDEVMQLLEEDRVQD